MVLGRAPKSVATKSAKRKATPDAYVNEGPTDLPTAYKQLTRSAFSVWIRLMVSTEEERKSGRRGLARLLDYKENRCNEVLRELKRYGYIEWIVTPGLPSEIVIIRRAKIWAKTQFVRIT